MIRRLRQVHGVCFSTLAVALPVFLVLAVRARHPRTTQSLPPELFPGRLPAEQASHEESDVLVYWVAEHAPRDTLPREAEFVGTLRAGAERISPPSGKRRLLYSLAHGRVLAEGLP